MFKPLPSDTVEYYPVRPEIAAAWLGLWSEFRRAARTETERLGMAHQAGLPHVMGILKAEYRNPFFGELSGRELDVAANVVPFIPEAPKEIAMLAARMMVVDAEQPVLAQIIHSCLHYDIAHFPANEPATIRLSMDNRVVAPRKVRVNVWHPDDGKGMIYRPSRRYTIRTSVPLTYVDKDGTEKSPKPYEILLMTGDTYHRSTEPDRPVASKYVQLGVFPYPVLDPK